MTKALLRRVHRWIGLALALPLIVQALTGFVLAADPFVSALQGVPAAIGPLIAPSSLRSVDVMAVLAAAHAAVPADQQPSRWRMLPDAIVAIDYTAPSQRQPMSQVGIDALTTQVLWVRQNPDSFYRWAHSVHETLLMGLQGRSIVGWIGIGLLLLAVSGIPLWWPPRRRWKTGFIVTPAARGWRFQRELHGAAGVWMVLLLLVQSVSGITMAFPQTARAIAGLPNLSPRGGRPVAGSKLDPNHALAAGIVAAEAQFPRAAVQDLRLPGTPDRPMVAFLSFNGDRQGAPRATVMMDMTTARVVSVQDPQSAPAELSVLNWLRALHDGGACGPAGRLLVCLFALMLPVFPLTGLAMWMLRRRQRRRPRASVAVARQ